MTISSLHKCRPRDYYSVRNYGGARDAVVFSKQDSRNKIKVAISKVAEGRKLSRFIKSCHTPRLDLITAPVFPNRINVGSRIVLAVPIKRLAEEILG